MNAINRRGYQDVPMTRRRAQLLAEYANKLADMLEAAPDDKDLAEWVQSKIDRAADQIQSAYHYLDQEDDDELEKARTKKYDYRRPSKRVNKKTGRREWDYFYTKKHGAKVSEGAFVEGAAFRLTWQGRRGHFHIDRVEGDQVFITHDSRPNMEPVAISKSELRALLKRQHAKAEQEHLDKKRRDVERIKSKGVKRGLGLALHRLRQAAQVAGVELDERYQRKPKKKKKPAQVTADTPREDRFDTMPEVEESETSFQGAYERFLDARAELPKPRKGQRDTRGVDALRALSDQELKALNEGYKAEEEKLEQLKAKRRPSFDAYSKTDLDLGAEIEEKTRAYRKLRPSERELKRRARAEIGELNRKREESNRAWRELSAQQKQEIADQTHMLINPSSGFGISGYSIEREIGRRLEERAQAIIEEATQPTPRNELTETAQQIIEEANQEHEERHDEHQEITKFELGEHTHTQTGAKLYTAKQKERTDRDEYFRRVEIAKKHGGRYERRYVRGFVFKTAEDARAFALEVEGAAQEAPETSAETVTPHEDHPSADNFETMPEVESAPRSKTPAPKTRADLAKLIHQELLSAGFKGANLWIRNEGTDREKARIYLSGKGRKQGMIEALSSQEYGSEGAFRLQVIQEEGLDGASEKEIQEAIDRRASALDLKLTPPKLDPKQLQRYLEAISAVARKLKDSAPKILDPSDRPVLALTLDYTETPLAQRSREELETLRTKAQQVNSRESRPQDRNENTHAVSVAQHIIREVNIALGETTARTTQPPTTPREQLTETAREVTRGADNFETMPEVESAGTPKSLLDDIRSEITVERFIREGRRREDTAEREVKKILKDLDALEQGLLNREYSTEAKQAKVQEILNRRLPKILEQMRRLVSAKLVQPQLSGGTGQRNAARYHRALGDIGIAADRANEEYQRALKELDRLEERQPQVAPREQLTETATETRLNVQQVRAREAIKRARGAQTRIKAGNRADKLTSTGRRARSSINEDKQLIEAIERIMDQDYREMERPLPSDINQRTPQQNNYAQLRGALNGFKSSQTLTRGSWTDDQESLKRKRIKSRSEIEDALKDLEARSQEELQTQIQVNIEDLPPKGQRTADDAKRFFGEPRKNTALKTVTYERDGHIITGPASGRGKGKFRYDLSLPRERFRDEPLLSGSSTSNEIGTYDTLDEALTAAINQYEPSDQIIDRMIESAKEERERTAQRMGVTPREQLTETATEISDQPARTAAIRKTPRAPEATLTSSGELSGVDKANIIDRARFITSGSEDTTSTGRRTKAQKAKDQELLLIYNRLHSDAAARLGPLAPRFADYSQFVKLSGIELPERAQTRADFRTGLMSSIEELRNATTAQPTSSTQKSANHLIDYRAQLLQTIERIA